MQQQRLQALQQQQQMKPALMAQDPRLNFPNPMQTNNMMTDFDFVSFLQDGTGGEEEGFKYNPVDLKFGDLLDPMTDFDVESFLQDGTGGGEEGGLEYNPADWTFGDKY
jgi:hypothetical protein